MVVTRSGKNTNKHEARIQRCGHECSTWDEHKCCACSDKRPHQATYVAYDQSYLSHASYVGRNHHYCPTCKTKPPTVKIDFSKMKPKPVSAPIVFHPTLEYKLAEAEKRIKELTLALEYSDAQLQVWKEQYKSAVNINNELINRIRDPFKSAISRPNF